MLTLMVNADLDGQGHLKVMTISELSNINQDDLVLINVLCKIKIYPLFSPFRS